MYVYTFFVHTIGSTSSLVLDRISLYFSKYFHGNKSCGIPFLLSLSFPFIRWSSTQEFFTYSLCLHCSTFLVKCLTVNIMCSHMSCPSLSRCTYIDISTQCHIICKSLFQKFVLLGYVLSEGRVLLPPPPSHPVMFGRDIIF